MLEQTITQNSALYLAQHKVQDQRNTPFPLRRAEGNRPLEFRKPTFSEVYFIPRFFQDKGH